MVIYVNLFVNSLKCLKMHQFGSEDHISGERQWFAVEDNFYGLQNLF